MVVKKIVVSKGVTMSVGKFESIRCDASVEIELDKGDDEDGAYEAGFEIVDTQINKQIGESQSILGTNSVFKQESKPKSNSRRRS